MKIKVLALALAILAFFLFVGSPFQQAANAIAVVDDGIIAIVIAFLAAVGITFVTSGAFSNSKEYVRNLLEEYASDRSMTLPGLFDGVEVGSNNLGKILVNNRFVVLMDGFIAWLIVKLNLKDHTNVSVISPGASLDEMTVYILPFTMNNLAGGGNLRWDYVEVTAPSGCYIVAGHDSGDVVNIYVFSKTYASYDCKVYRNGILSTTYNLSTDTYSPNEGYLYYIGVNSAAASFATDPNVSFYPNADILNALRGHEVDTSDESLSIYTGDINPPADDSDYSPGDGAILDVGASWGDTYPDITDEVIPDAFSDSEIANTSITYETEEEVQEQVEDTPAQQISQEVNDYQVAGLASVFPFCIPFDIYNFFDCLAADPVAPSFEWRFYVPDICDETIEIDLAQFNTVAQIVRTMELLAFIVGLAFVTRDKMIKG